MDSNIYEKILPIYQEGKINWQEIADQYGLGSKDAARGQFRRERKRRGDAPVSLVEHADELEQRETTSYKELEDDSIHIVCDSKRIRTREDVIEHFNIDTNIWKVKEFTVRTSEGYRKDRKVTWKVEEGSVTEGNVEDTGKILIVPLVHTETKLVRKELSDMSLQDIDTFFANLSEKNIPSIKSEARQYQAGGLVLEIAFADGHIGNESLTYDQIKERCIFVVNDIKRRSKGLLLEKIILAQMGDIFHMDTYNRTTTSGTQMTYNTNPNTMFDNGVDLLVWMITELSAISKVEVINIYGNHDKLSSYMLAKVIETYFRNDPNVEVDASHDIRKFRKIGISSVAFVHGDMPKTNLHDVFQQEARKIFGETIYSEIHVGHLHHEHSLEKGGVITRWLPSITTPDEYHKNKGYTSAKQGVQCFLWDLDHGLENVWMIPVGQVN